jgi:uncharacterized membrane protein YraQ (UPF0718 family)
VVATHLGLVVCAIAVGAAIGLLSGRVEQALSPLRTFAFVSAALVVLCHLLPEAIAREGMAAVGVFAAGLATPLLFERAGRRARDAGLGRGRGRDLGLEIGYAGLLVHNVGDGLAIAAYAGPLATGAVAPDVALSIASHSIPVTVLVVVAFARHHGASLALRRAVGLAIATVVGALLVDLVPPPSARAWEPWIAAGLGGLLLHVIAHDCPVERARDRRQRMPEMFAIVAAAGLVLGGSDHAEVPAAELRATFGDALLDLGLEAAPMLLLGLLAGAVVQTLGGWIPEGFLRGGGALRQALRGAVVGSPLPVCACGVLPIGNALRQRGAGAALVVAFLLATPQVGIETFMLTVRFLGGSFAAIRVGVGLLAAIVAAVAIAQVAARANAPSPVADRGAPDSSVFVRDRRAPLLVRLASNFDELVDHSGAWIVVGVVAAAFAQIAVPADALHRLEAGGLDVILVSLVAIPSYVCAASATPLAAVLVHKGLSPGAALALLLLGPATNVATVAALRRWYGGRAAACGLAALVGVVWIVAFAINAAPVPIAAGFQATTSHDHGIFAQGSLGLCCALFVRQVWRHGLRGWVASLGDLIASHDHDHACAGHGHAHGGHAEDASPAQPVLEGASSGRRGAPA